MAGPKKRSRKRSGGRRRRAWQRSRYVLYLDENLCSCQPILAALKANAVRYVSHLDYHGGRRGIQDDQWLPIVGRNRWLLVTKDKGIRYNELEKAQVVRYKVRQFSISSGNLSGDEMAKILVKHLDAIARLCRRERPPFIASITMHGVLVRFRR